MPLTTMAPVCDENGVGARTTQPLSDGSPVPLERPHPLNGSVKSVMVVPPKSSGGGIVTTFKRFTIALANPKLHRFTQPLVLAAIILLLNLVFSITMFIVYKNRTDTLSVLVDMPQIEALGSSSATFSDVGTGGDPIVDLANSGSVSIISTNMVVCKTYADKEAFQASDTLGAKVWSASFMLCKQPGVSYASGAPVYYNKITGDEVTYNDMVACPDVTKEVIDTKDTYFMHYEKGGCYISSCSSSVEIVYTQKTSVADAIAQALSYTGYADAFITIFVCALYLALFKGHLRSGKELFRIIKAELTDDDGDDFVKEDQSVRENKHMHQRIGSSAQFLNSTHSMGEIPKC